MPREHQDLDEAGWFYYELYQQTVLTVPTLNTQRNYLTKVTIHLEDMNHKFQI